MYTYMFIYLLLLYIIYIYIHICGLFIETKCHDFSNVWNHVLPLGSFVARSLMPLLPETTRRFYPFTQTQDPPAEKKPPMSRVGYPDFIVFFFKREWKRSESFD